MMQPLIGLQQERPRFFELMVDELERVFAGYRPRFPLIPRDG